jgi:hypothetical protein
MAMTIAERILSGASMNEALDPEADVRDGETFGEFLYEISPRVVRLIREGKRKQAVRLLNDLVR